ncbi:hypothetical protein CQA66_08885 [Helicobacter aurati]|uniref:Uncharacterized protein n=1 Tax=Helicobacter aurati TaxID=137778 RepID=A0A3D8IWV8_9HELI|nr:hypothetical protein [Helicobacter aurati]RDU69769.1 hypothetical protein CQA66_08885 [Helicobacter aurati]
MKPISHDKKPIKNSFKSDSKTKQLQEEIYFLEAQILDMFEVIFFFAGLDPEHLSHALEYYTQLLDSQEQDQQAVNIEKSESKPIGPAAKQARESRTDIEIAESKAKSARVADEEEYTAQSIIALIQKIQRDKPEWFRH